MELQPLALCALAAAVAVPGGDPGVVLENARILTASGPEIPRGSVVIRDGKIVAVGATVEVPAGARRVDLSGKVLCPGFVDAASRLGLPASDRGTPARDPEAPASDSADLGDAAFAAARGAGVTAVLLSPGAPRGTFAGRLSLVKTAPGGGVEARVAEARGPLKVVMAPPGPVSSVDRAAAAANLRAAFRAALDYQEARERYRRDLRSFLEEAAAYAAAGDAPEEAVLPPAVLDRLRRLDPEPREAARRALRGRLGMKEPEKPVKFPRRPAEPREDPLRETTLAAIRGEIGVRFEAHAVEDVRAALVLAGEFRLKATFEGGIEAGRMASVLGKGRTPVACWPAEGPGAEPDGPPAEANPGLLAGAGARVAVATGDAGPLAARNLVLAAAMAAGHGLDRVAALRAVTLDAAAAAGFEGRIGSIEAGKDGDLVVLDGDPLAAATKVVGVWIDGVEVPLP